MESPDNNTVKQIANFQHTKKKATLYSSVFLLPANHPEAF